MLLESSLCSNTATCVPQASQACWRIARDRKASGQYVRSEALWLDALLEFVHAVHSCGPQSTRPTAPSARAQTGTVLREKKRLAC